MTWPKIPYPIYNLCCKSMKTRENSWNVYSLTNPMRDETANLKVLTTKPHYGLAMTWHEMMNWLFLPRQIFSFTVFKYWNCFFFLFQSIYKQRIDMSQSQAMLPSVYFTCSSKGHASWLWLLVFDPYLSVAEKPSPDKWSKSHILWGSTYQYPT